MCLGYVIHGEELLYVFRFRNPSTGTIIDIDDAEGQQVRGIMTSLWTTFAKHGYTFFTLSLYTRIPKIVIQNDWANHEN